MVKVQEEMGNLVKVGMGKDRELSRGEFEFTGPAMREGGNGLLFPSTRHSQGVAVDWRPFPF